MALTRTDDKLDKGITRLLMQSPLGLTIGDITAAAKCTPQTARKSLARIGAEKDASGMLYVLRDDDEQASEAAQPEPEAEPTAPTKRPETMRANWGGIQFLNPFADAHAPEPTDPAPAAVSEPAPAPADEQIYWIVLDKDGDRMGDLYESMYEAADANAASVEDMLRDGYGFQQVAVVVRTIFTVRGES